MASSINQILAYTIGNESISLDADFFSLGMDFLQVIHTARYLKAGLKKAGVEADEMAPSSIYANPTISKLASAIETLRQGSQKAEESIEQTRMELMEAMMKKCSSCHGHDGQATQHQNNSPKRLSKCSRSDRLHQRARIIFARRFSRYRFCFTNILPQPRPGTETAPRKRQSVARAEDALGRRTSDFSHKRFHQRPSQSWA